MRSFKKRAWLVLGLGAMAVPLVATALAYGCTAIATLRVSSSSAPPSSVVTVTGKGFGTHDPADERSNQPAEIRLGSLTSPVLATASPTGPEGNFSVQVTVPADASPGDTFVAATQKRADGRTVYGTPARQALTVSAPPPAPAAAPTQPPASTPPASTNRDPQRVVDNRATLRKAIASCTRQYSSKKATRAIGKRRLARRRAACIKRAQRRFS